MFDRIRDYIRKNHTELTMALGAGVGVFVIYTVVNLIIWNVVSLSYGAFYGLASAALYFIIQRLLKYLVTKKEGVIEKRA
jgi:hypothetical protein